MFVDKQGLGACFIRTFQPPVLYLNMPATPLLVNPFKHQDIPRFSDKSISLVLARIQARFVAHPIPQS